MNRRMCEIALTAVVAGLLYAGCLDPAAAQNPTCPTRPAGDNTNACASTAFVQNAAGETYDVKKYGATGNGSTDDTIAIQAAATAACSTAIGTGGAAKSLYFPAGFYKITATIVLTCNAPIHGDGWSSDSSALLQNTALSSTAGLSGSIILPSSTINAISITTNQATTVRDIGIFYVSRPAAGSGLTGLKIQAAATTTAPAPLAFNSNTLVSHVWFYGADIQLALVNAGWDTTVVDSVFQMHATNGVKQSMANIPYAGNVVYSRNQFASGSVTNCQHILATSGGMRVANNHFQSCGSNNIIPPLYTAGIAIVPDLNVAQNSIEPVIISDNTIEGMTYCVLFDGSTPGQNASLTQVTITGNQFWCVEPVRTTATSASAAWISGVVISGNILTAQTIAGHITATYNLNIGGAQYVNVVGNQYGLVQAVGTDTSTAINIGTASVQIRQAANQSSGGAFITVDNTIPAPSSQVTYGLAGSGTGLIRLSGATSGTVAITPQAAAGTYNFNLPTTAGSAGQCLTSQGGGSSAMTWSACGGGITIGTSTITSGTTTRVLYDDAGVVGEYAISGSGNVAMTTSPAFTTPNLGTPSAVTLTNGTGLPLSGLASQANNTVVGNISGSSASPTALTTAQGMQLLAVGQVMMRATGVAFDAAGDTAISITLPANVTRYRVTACVISGSNGDLSAATFGLFTATGGGGTALIAGGTAITVTTGSEGTANNMMTSSVGTVNTTSHTATTLYFRIGSTAPAGRTGNVTLIVQPIS